MNNKGPWQKVVDAESVAERSPRIDVVEFVSLSRLSEIASHELPKVASGGKLSLRRGTKLAHDARHVRIPRLQIQCQMVLGKRLDNPQILHKKNSPRLVQTNCFASAAAVEVVEAGERCGLALLGQRLDFAVLQRVLDAPKLTVEPWCQEARRNVAFEILQLGLRKRRAIDKFADGIGRSIWSQPRRLLDVE